MKAGRLFALVGISLVTVLAAGYAIALSGASACEDEVRAEVLNRGVAGLAMSGEVIPASQIEVYSRVEYPFVVGAGYSVPYDLHASYHETRFLVLPWHLRKLSTQKFLAM